MINLPDILANSTFRAAGQSRYVAGNVRYHALISIPVSSNSLHIEKHSVRNMRVFMRIYKH